MRYVPIVMVVALATASCSADNDRPTEPIAALREAARHSLAAPSADLQGVMTVGRGREVVTFNGLVDLPRHRTRITIAPGRYGGKYPPYEIRYVDGWNYVEIDPAVRRPATLRPDAQWVASRTTHGTLPILDRAIPPALPVNALRWPLDRRITRTDLVSPPARGRWTVTVRFAGKDSRTAYTYVIDRGHITSVAVYDAPYQQGAKLWFTYTTATPSISAPSAHVQRLQGTR